MSMIPRTDYKVFYYKQVVLAMVRNEASFFDLTNRQRAVMLVVYTEQPHQTVRGLASVLQVERPAISRALNRLTELNLLERQADPLDGRSIVVVKTAAGNIYMRSLRTTLTSAERLTTRNMERNNGGTDRYRKLQQRSDAET